jgi:hypothetical protein
MNIQSPDMHERVVCSLSAAAKYQIPANIVLAVAEKENGRAGQWVRNRNGTHDVGPLQFNTAYIAQLSKYGITSAAVAQAGCYSYDLAAWRLRLHIFKDKGDFWTRVANYHSRTPHFNEIYRIDLMRRADRWGDRLARSGFSYQIPLPRSTFPLLMPAANYRNVVGAARMPTPSASRPNVTYVPRRLIVGDGR